MTMTRKFGISKKVILDKTSSLFSQSALEIMNDDADYEHTANMTKQNPFQTIKKLLGFRFCKIFNDSIKKLTNNSKRNIPYTNISFVWQFRTKHFLIVWQLSKA